MLCKRAFTGITRSIMHGGVGHPMRRGALMRSVANAGDKNCSGRTTGPGHQRMADKCSGTTTPLERITSAYKTTDFEATLAEAPRQALWTVIATVTPLIGRPLYTGLLADHSAFVVGYVSLYVFAANGWMLADRDDRDELWSSPTSFRTFLWTVFPLIECAAAIAALSPTVGVLAVEHAAFQTAVLLLDGPAAGNTWRRSSVLLVFGISTSSLTIALITTFFT